MPSTPGLPRPPRPCLECTTPTRNPGGRCDTHKKQHGKRHRDRTAYYFTTDWRSLADQCKTRDYKMCVVCAGENNLTAHHIKPRTSGGVDALPNLVTLCRRCHSAVEAGRDDIAKALRTHLKAVRPTDIDGH